MLLYEHGFSDFQMGYASALAMLLLAVSFAVTLVIVLNSRTLGAPGGAAMTTAAHARARGARRPRSAASGSSATSRTHAVLIALAIAFLLPFVFITLTALMTNDQALSSQLWPHPFRLLELPRRVHQGAAAALDVQHDGLLVLATLGVARLVACRSPTRSRASAGAAATRPFMVVLVALMLPPQVTVVPLYVMWAKLHLVGTLWPVILPNWFGDAFSIFLLRQFFLTIPEEYLDAARVDGCGELRILFTVVTRLAKPAIAAVALFSFLYTFNDFFLPLLYVGENSHNWVLSIGLAAVPLVPPGAVEPDDGGDAARDGAGDHPLLPRAARFRRGRHADRGEGMKIAVVGGGSTYTPELVSGLSRLDVSSSCCTTSTPSGARSSAGWRGACSSGRATRGRSTVTTISTAPSRDADFVLVQIRVGGQDARLADETMPLACGCIGQETTGAGGLAKALRTVPVVLEIAERVRELSDAWIVDFTNPVGIVTRALLDERHRAIGLCNVAIGFQRQWARLARRRTRRASSSTRSASTT